MCQQYKKQLGFGLLGTILLVLVASAILGTSWYVFQQNRPEDSQASPDISQNENSNQQVTTEPEPAAKYLAITELGLRLKLTDATKDAYYKLSDKTSRTGVPSVFLSTRSLDEYVGCVADNDSHGVSVMSTFDSGYKDEVVGDYAGAYPNAPLIHNLYYFIVGNQYDCTLEQDSELLNSVRTAFIDSYSTIALLPN